MIDALQDFVFAERFFIVMMLFDASLGVCRAEKCNLLQKSGEKIWWFPQKLLPLHSQFRNELLA